LVTKSSDADAILEGTIQQFSYERPSDDKKASHRDYRLRIHLDIRLIDLKTNEIIINEKGLAFSHKMDSIEDNFFDLPADEIKKIAEKFASTTIIKILENF